MIKVGDYIRIKKEVPCGLISDSIEGNKFPLEVKSIGSCPSRGFKECKECPGHINKDNICFGRTWGYLVEPFSIDWDE